MGSEREAMKFDETCSVYEVDVSVENNTIRAYHDGVVLN